MNELISPDDLAHWKKLCEEAIYLRSLDENRALRLTPETEDGLLSFLAALIPAYGRVVLEQIASNRTIAHLVARKDALEEQYQVLGEQSRITLEVAAQRQEALEAQVRELEQERDRLAHNLAVTENEVRTANSRANAYREERDAYERTVKQSDIAHTRTKEERDALAAAMPSEGADAALAYAAMRTERDALRARASTLKSLCETAGLLPIEWTD